jgi:hypothetical protein
MKKPAGANRRAVQITFCLSSAESGNSLAETRKFPRDSIFVEHALRNAFRHFWLCVRKRSHSCCLVASTDSGLNLLHEGADTADPVMVHHSAAIIAPDALFGLWRIRHGLFLE